MKTPSRKDSGLSSVSAADMAIGSLPLVIPAMEAALVPLVTAPVNGTAKVQHVLADESGPSSLLIHQSHTLSGDACFLAGLTTEASFVRG